MGLAALVAVALGAGATAGPLDWMAGTWCTQGSARRTCEHWEPMIGGTMLGTSQTLREGRTVGFEFLRIAEEDGQATYHASPQAGPATAFREAERADRRIVFLNAGHDYPQRIAYWREGDALMAEISLADGSRANRWLYRPETKD